AGTVAVMGQPTHTTTSGQQLTETNSQLVAATSALSTDEAKLEKTRAMIAADKLDSIPEVLASTLIQKLREAEADVQRKLADLGAVYQKRHPFVMQAEAQLTKTRGAINGELTKIVAALSSQVERDRATQASLEKRLRALEDENTQMGVASVQ